MSVTIPIDPSRTTVNEVFGVSFQRMNDMGMMLNDAIPGLQTQVQVIQKMRDIATSDNEFALLLLYYDLAKE